MDKIYIDQVVIGSCTNGRLSDLEKAAAILKDKKVADNVRVMVVPATQKIFLQCIQKGLAEIFVEAGCAFNTPSCGPCMGVIWVLWLKVKNVFQQQIVTS